MSGNSPFIIKTANLRKTFKGKGKTKKIMVEAVRGVSLEVKAGEIFGLLGPNGAGKTTTMRILATLLTPTSGEAEVVTRNLFKDSAQIRKEIGYVSQVGGMLREATGRENLVLQARLSGMNQEEATARVKELLKLLALESFADRRTSSYSGGQRRIFDLAAGIVHRPKLLFLDEPSTGLDPQNRAHVWEQVKKLHDEGTSVFVTTHYLEEADALCDRVAIMDQGQIVAMGTPEELKKGIAGDVVSLGFDSGEIAEEAKGMLGEKEYIKEIQNKEETLHLFVERGDENLPLIMKILHENNISAKTIELSRPSLDDVFLKLTGRTLRETE